MELASSLHLTRFYVEKHPGGRFAFPLMMLLMVDGKCQVYSWDFFFFFVTFSVVINEGTSHLRSFYRILGSLTGDKFLHVHEN